MQSNQGLGTRLKYNVLSIIATGLTYMYMYMQIHHIHVISYSTTILAKFNIHAEKQHIM